MQKDNRSPSSKCPTIPVSAVHQKRLRAGVANRPNLPRLYDRATPLETSVVFAATNLYEFFHLNGYQVTRNDWATKTTADALLRYRGWVYAFYGDEEFPIYVGETGRTLKHRFCEHEKKDPAWWGHWTAVKVLPCPDQSIRKVFESLIGLAGGYKANKLQPAGADNIFDDVILSLLLLGNDNNRLPIFPTLSD